MHNFVVQCILLVTRASKSVVNVYDAVSRWQMQMHMKLV